MLKFLPWLSMLALAALPGTLAPPRCAAESPLLPVAPPPPIAAGRELPPSAVAPSIERFVREHAASLPAPRPAAVPRAAAPTPVPVPPRARPISVVEEPRLPGTDPRTAQGPADDPAPPAAVPNPLFTNLTLKPPPLEPSDVGFPIDLASALKLSDARPLVVAAAQAGVWVAEADLTRAKALWLPTILFGIDYIRHDGGGPDFNKGIMTAPSVNFFYAGGSLAQYVNLTDVIFEPLAARQVLNARHHDVQSAKNDALLRTARAYFQVHRYRGMYAGALYSVDRARELVARIRSLRRELVPRVEVDRARNMLADLEQRAVSARQLWRRSSADLTEVLRLDPRAVIVPMEHDHLQITLIDPARPLDDLLPVALINRPELGARQALVKAAEIGIRREKSRPLLPLVMLNGFQSAGMLIQAGVFGIGPNSSLNQFTGRDDISVQMMWQLENFGAGNLARIKRQRGQESQAIVDLRRTQDQVSAEVIRAQADVQSAAVRVHQADRALRTAIITFNGNFEGLRETTRFGDVLVLVNRPQEAVFAVQLLNVAFDEYFTTVADYNRAQFELFHAMGYPARELAELRPPGALVPVDTSRPAYLPPVGHGPPPASR